MDFGLSPADGAVPVIETLSAQVSAGEMELCLRLQPPVGSEARRELDRVMQRLRQRAGRGPEKRSGPLAALFPSS